MEQTTMIGMRIPALLAVAILACGPAQPSSAPQERPGASALPDGGQEDQDASEGVLESPEGDAVAPSAEAGPDAKVPDAAKTVPDAGAPDTSGALAACHAQACANVQAQCGAVAAPSCGIATAECGTCQPGYGCGDQVANRCGYFCADTGLANYCPNNLPGMRAFNQACNAPYWFENGVRVLRPNGTQGCTGFSPSSTLHLLCCPP